MPTITLTIGGEPRFVWTGDAHDVDGIVSEHVDWCQRCCFNPDVIARQILLKEARGVDHGLADVAVATAVIYYCAMHAFLPWSGYEKFAAGCNIDLDLRIVDGGCTPTSALTTPPLQWMTLRPRPYRRSNHRGGRRYWLAARGGDAAGVRLPNQGDHR
jgi:hypothetical protein